MTTEQKSEVEYQCSDWYKDRPVLLLILSIVVAICTIHIGKCRMGRFRQVFLLILSTVVAICTFW